jgi:uncharacterized membrane protein YiaA
MRGAGLCAPGGIGAATVSDVQLNPLGAFFGVASTACVCFVTVLTNTMQKTHELTSFQMLLNVAPVEGIMLLVIGPVWDYWVGVTRRHGSGVQASGCRV